MIELFINCYRSSSKTLMAVKRILQTISGVLGGGIGFATGYFVGPMVYEKLKAKKNNSNSLPFVLVDPNDPNTVTMPLLPQEESGLMTRFTQDYTFDQFRTLFRSNPDGAAQDLRQKLNMTHEEVGKLLYEKRDQLDPNCVGYYLEHSLPTQHAYISSIKTQGQSFFKAIHNFLSEYVFPPKEDLTSSSVILETIAQDYCDNYAKANSSPKDYVPLLKELFLDIADLAIKGLPEDKEKWVTDTWNNFSKKEAKFITRGLLTSIYDQLADKPCKIQYLDESKFT